MYDEIAEITNTLNFTSMQTAGEHTHTVQMQIKSKFVEKSERAIWVVWPSGKRPCRLPNGCWFIPAMNYHHSVAMMSVLQSKVFF